MDEIGQAMLCLKLSGIGQASCDGEDYTRTQLEQTCPANPSL